MLTSFTLEWHWVWAVIGAVLMVGKAKPEHRQFRSRMDAITSGLIATMTGGLGSPVLLHHLSIYFYSNGAVPPNMQNFLAFILALLWSAIYYEAIPAVWKLIKTTIIGIWGR